MEEANNRSKDKLLYSVHSQRRKMMLLCFLFTDLLDAHGVHVSNVCMQCSMLPLELWNDEIFTIFGVYILKQNTHIWTQCKFTQKHQNLIKTHRVWCFQIVWIIGTPTHTHANRQKGRLTNIHIHSIQFREIIIIS